MDDDRGGSSDHHLHPDPDPLTGCCSECIREIENDDVICEKRYQEASGLSTEKMYQIFQNSAAAVAQMYNGEMRL